MKKPTETGIIIAPPPSKLKTQVNDVQKEALDLEIESQKDANHAADVLQTVKTIESAISARKEEITRPLMAGLSSARDLFKPLELGLAEAKRAIKEKLLAYQTAADERVAREKARIAARVDKGTMKGETAIAKLEALDVPEEDARGSFGKVSTRTLVKVRVVDVSLIPREYLLPDLVKITEAILRQGATIAGCEKYEEKILASSRS